jgi:branched-chain amino acid transport system permease protein
MDWDMNTMNDRKRVVVVRRGVLARLQSRGPSPLALVVLALSIVAPFLITDEYILRLLTISLFLGCEAMVFDFSGGFIGIINFGLAGTLGLAAYTSALLVLRVGISPWIGMIAGASITGLLGFLVGVLVLRLGPFYAAMMTWFVAMTLQAIALAAVSITNGAMGISVPLLFDTPSTRPYYFVMLLILVVTYAVMQAVIRSHIGLAFRAIGQNPDAARASGIDPYRYKLLNFTVASLFAGFLGAFYGHFIGILTPSFLGTSRITEVMALAYIGGRGSLWGGILAALLIIPIFEYLKSLMAFRFIIYGLLLIFVMLFWPGGLSSSLARVNSSIRKNG